MDKKEERVESQILVVTCICKSEFVIVSLYEMKGMKSMRLYHKEMRKVKGIVYCLDVLLCIEAVCLCALFIIEVYTQFMPIVLFLIFMLVFVVLTVLLCYVSYRLHKRIHAVSFLYEELSMVEKELIEHELMGNQGRKDSYFGNTCLYAGAGMGHFVIPYQAIAWYFPYETSIAIVESPIDGLLKGHHENEEGIVVFIKSGHQLRMHMQDSHHACELLQELAPHALYGYSKQRYQAAKKDFSYFLQHIQDVDFEEEEKKQFQERDFDI